MLDDYAILTESEADAFWNMVIGGFFMGLMVFLMPLGFMLALRIAGMGK